MDSRDKLLHIETIRRLKASYFRTLDGKDWDGYAALFTDDATMDVSDDLERFAAHGFELPISAGDMAKTVIGARRLADFVHETVGDARTVHHGHMPEIDIISATEARGIWGMTDIVERSALLLRGAGHYHETYRLVDGRWLISSLHLTRLRIDFFAPAENGGWRQITTMRGKERFGSV